MIFPTAQNVSDLFCHKWLLVAEVRGQFQDRQFELQRNIKRIQRAYGGAILEEYRSNMPSATPPNSAQNMKLLKFYNASYLICFSIALILAATLLAELQDVKELCETTIIPQIFLASSITSSSLFLLYNIAYFFKLVRIKFDPEKINSETRDIFESDSYIFKFSSYGVFAEAGLIVLSWYAFTDIKNCSEQFPSSFIPKFVVLSVLESVDIYIFPIFLAKFILTECFGLSPSCFCKPGAKSRMPGIEDKDIRNIAVVVYSPSAKVKEETCPCCEEPFKSGDTLRVLPCRDRHRFHNTCISFWLINQETCPECHENVLKIISGPVIRSTAI